MENNVITNQLTEKETGFKWVILLSCILLMTSLTTISTSWSVAVEELSAAHNISSTQVMLGSSLFVMGLVITNGVCGRFIEVFGYKKVGGLMLFISIISQALIPLCSSFTVILVLRLLVGLGMCWSPLYYLVGQWFPPQQRGLAVGCMGGAFFLGLAVGGALSGQLLPVLGWKATFYVFTAIMTVCVIQWLIITRRTEFVESEEKKAKEVSAQSETLNDHDNVFKHPMIWLLGLVYFADYAAVYATENATSAYLAASSYDTEAIGTLVFYISILGVVGAPLAGIISDACIRKYSSKQPHMVRAVVTAVGGMLIVGIGVTLVILLGTSGFALCAIAMLIIGWGNSFMDSLSTMLGIDAFGPTKGDKAIGYMAMIGGIGGVIAPTGITWIGDTYGWTTAWAVVLVVLAIGIVGTISVAKRPAEY